MSISNLLRNSVVAVSGFFVALGAYAATPEGYWKALDDQTGQPLSIVEISKDKDNVYSGKIVYRYPNATGYVLKNCDKCQGANKGKPIIGMKVLAGLKETPGAANQYNGATLLDVRSGKVYKGKATLSPDGKQLKLRGYVGISLFGRGTVYLRTDSPHPQVE